MHHLIGLLDRDFVRGHQRMAACKDGPASGDFSVGGRFGLFPGGDTAIRTD